MDWTTFFIIIGGVILLGVIGLVWFLLNLKSYDFQLRIRELTSDNTKIITDKRAKIKRDRDKVEFLGLYNKFQGYKNLPLPPKEVIDYNIKKNKKVIECYFAQDKGFIYLTDKKEIDMFEPFPTKQRSMMVNELWKKEQRKVKDWKENIPLYAGLLTLVLIIAMFMIFYGEAVKPVNERYDRLMNNEQQIYDKWETLISKLDVVINGNKTQIIRTTPP
jgi:hypothetical protein